MLQILNNTNNDPRIICGDWNCTYSTVSNSLNPDVLNMVSTPNPRHAKLLTKLCDDFELADPFRTKYPNQREFSYVLSDPTKKNRSRIDFFITSRAILQNITECTISPNLQSKMFDHKAIHLSTIVKKSSNPTIPTISHAILCDPDLDYVVGLAVADTYANSTAALIIGGWEAIKQQIGQSKDKLRCAGPSNIHMLPGDRSEYDEPMREGLIAEIREFLDG